MRPQLPCVDVLIPTLNEERYLRRCLEQVLGQAYPADRMRVLLIDNGSTDATCDIAHWFAASDSRVEVIADGHRRTVPESLNLAREYSSAELVARIDAHGYPERDFLRLAAEHLALGGSRVGCVGGRPIQEGDTRFGRAVALARTSRFGVGASEYAASSEHGQVNTVQCGVYRRKALDVVGWFNPLMNFGEDEEVNWRIRRAGYEILLDSRMRFHYVTRPSWRSAFRQYRNYGEARVRVVQEHPDFLRPHHLVPAALVASAGALSAAAPLSATARRGLAALGAAYGVSASAAALAVARDREPELWPAVAACYGALHLGYGLGTLRGLAHLVADRVCSGRTGPLSA